MVDPGRVIKQDSLSRSSPYEGRVYKMDLMSEDHKAALRKNARILSENINLNSALWSTLISKDIIGYDDKDRIQKKADSPQDEVLRLLQITEKQADNTFNLFIESLEECRQGHVAQILKQPGNCVELGGLQAKLDIDKDSMHNGKKKKESGIPVDQLCSPELSVKRAVPYIKTEKRRIPESVDPKTLNTDFDIGSSVSIKVQGIQLYGVIKWIGFYGDRVRPIAGIEMEHDFISGTDGTYMQYVLFTCPPKRAVFTYLDKVTPDRRFCKTTNQGNYGS